jgi:hypothetical protein
VAVKVTLVPTQIAPEGTAAILTLTGNEAFTDIVNVFEVAGLPVAHGAALDVNTQVTRSPLAKAAFVYVVLFAPTFAPFSFHW